MINSRNILAGFLLIFTLALCFVWPIPNHLILFHRNGLVYYIILVSIGLFLSSPSAKQSLHLNKTKFVLIFISLFTIYILMNGFFVAPDIKEMFYTWNGQWLRPVLLFFAGVVILPAIQSCFPSISAPIFFTLIILFFWGVVCIHFFDISWLYWRDGVVYWGKTNIVYNRTRMSFQVNIITGFLVAELLARYLLKQRFLRLKTPFLAIMLFCNVACTVIVDTRWGTIGLVGSLLSTFILLAVQGMRHGSVDITCSVLIWILVVVATAVVLGYASWNTDPRWHSLKDDAIIGWNAPFSSFCYIKPNGIVPTNYLGHPINHSNACRASFFNQGWKLVGKHPAGIGPRKEAFGYVLRRDTQNTHITTPHSHYGLIEFGIQNGIAGIVGWLILLAGYWCIAWKEFRHGKTMVGMFLLLFTISFFSRTMVDHNLKDHYLEQYMFLTGLLTGMCALRTKKHILLSPLLDYNILAQCDE